MPSIVDRIDPSTLPPSVRRIGKRGLRLGRSARQRAKLLRQVVSPAAGVGFDDLPTPMAIRMAYETVLDRSPEPQDYVHYTAELETTTRARMLEIMRGSEEAYMNVRVTDLLNSLHLSRCDFVRSLPRARRILDLGGSHQSNREGAFVHLGYPYPFERLILVDLPIDERHEIYQLSEKAEVVETALGPVEYAYHSMADLSRYDDESFDLVYSGQTIEHVTPEECDDTLAETFRVLQPGGYFAVDTPNDTVCRLQRPDFINDDHKVEYSHEEFTAKLRKAGFEIVDAKGLNYLGHPASEGGFDEIEVARNNGLYGEPQDCYLLAYICRKPG
ncbi:MAG TPA: methyltransferase domain-containing protein [Acidimicrobiales bacterium]|nr:methyltransferase domain-containing protein [Acidimicrobiales bacterium]